MLASNHAIESHCDAGKPLELPHAQAILGDVVYGGYRVPYPSNATKTYRLRLQFDGDVEQPTNLWFVQIDYQQDKDHQPLSDSERIYRLENHLQTGFKHVPTLTDDKGKAAEVRNDDTFRQENVTQIRVPATKSRWGGRMCVCVRCTSHDDERKDLLDARYRRRGDTTQTRGNHTGTRRRRSGQYARTFEDRLTMVLCSVNNAFRNTIHSHALCTDYIVDGDASIVRSTKTLRTRKGTPPPRLCSTRLSQPSTPFIVNDGWMYTGTLRLPTRPPNGR